MTDLDFGIYLNTRNERAEDLEIGVPTGAPWMEGKKSPGEDYLPFGGRRPREMQT